MGAWGIGAFENDTACDWVYELEQTNDTSIIEKTIVSLFDDEYIDADVACEVLAAIEALARLKGKPGKRDAYTEALDKWVSKVNVSIGSGLLEKAIEAIEAILGSSSELRELWEETEDYSEWVSDVTDLKTRISA